MILDIPNVRLAIYLISGAVAVTSVLYLSTILHEDDFVYYAWIPVIIHTVLVLSLVRWSTQRQKKREAWR